MGFFDFLKQPDFDQGVMEYHNTPGAILLDVRTPAEYRQGHIPSSRNVPLQTITQVDEIADPDTPLYVYCQSGARSRQAASVLLGMGYTNVKNLGGINAYSGKVEY
ncbi:MAG: rhodanese-like domain-containing protein [Oscillospiraceae bacterium]|nr:rhodanese-like domain-containing protein [Oscillospiraceae bacterium]